MNVSSINYKLNNSSKYTKFYGKSTNKYANRGKYTNCDSVSFHGGMTQAKPVALDTMKDLLRRCSELMGNPQNAHLVDNAAALISAGEINQAIDFLAKHTLPNGSIKELANETVILARNWDGSPKEHIFKHVPGFKNLGLYKEVNPADIYEKAFGYIPKATVGMVGWTNVKPDNVKGGTSLSKAELTNNFVESIESFFKPVYNYILSLGADPKDIVLVSSVSYDGVDKAIMDIGQKMEINTLTITPFDYAIYGRNEHPFPTLITDTVKQYADIYSVLSNIVIVTGGRDHAFKYDAGNKWLKQSDGLLIPIDVLKEYKHIEIPGTVNGKVENAAALAYETFSNPLPESLAEGFKDLPYNSLKQELTNPAQQALATAIWKRLA